jgi:DNA-binding response OmpR family regulator
MARPTFLVAEPEPRDALSTRKLVLETAKFNVITSHSSQETIELLKSFPNVDAVVVVAEMKNIGNAVSGARTKNPKMPVIVLSPNNTTRFEGADHLISTHEPEKLLGLLRELFGDPRSN